MTMEQIHTENGQIPFSCVQECVYWCGAKIYHWYMYKDEDGKCCKSPRNDQHHMYLPQQRMYQQMNIVINEYKISINEYSY